jgi:hypothetical protein
MANDKYSAQQMIAALTATKGMITLAAKQMGCAPNTVRSYIAKYPTVAEAQKQAHDEMGDAAELKLYNKAMGTKINPDGDTTALIFLLKTQYKKRGYVERTENVNFSVDNDTIKRAIDALEQQGLSASDVFNNIIASAAESAQRESVRARPAGEE